MKNPLAIALLILSACPSSLFTPDHACRTDADCTSDGQVCIRSSNDAPGFCAPACGNGAIDPGEACDDGNKIDDDGCSRSCVRATCGDGIVRQDLIEGSQGFEACDDGNVVNGDDCSDTCRLPRCGDGLLQTGEQCDDGNATGADACTAACQTARCGDGIVRLDVAGGGDGFEACDDANDDDDDGCVRCAAARCGDGVRRNDLDAGETGFEACDDGNPNNTDTCTSSCAAARCGDGQVQLGQEACDDGNARDDDVCTNNCDLARCGDGLIRRDRVPGEDGYEACDDGNSFDGDACTGCRQAVCGDGVLQADVEACDDGNRSSADSCSNACANAFCGDGFLHAGIEVCDDGNLSNDDDCTDTCRAARCGDGVLRGGLAPGDPNYEICDDGNQNDLDGCRNNCRFAACGDGVVRTDVEACDDGNLIDTDACTNRCVAASCGDGVVWDGHELCDDGNPSDTDACLTSCAVNVCGDGHRYLGEEDCDDGNVDEDDGCTTLCAAPRCGDGVVSGDEACDDGNRDQDDACLNDCSTARCGDGIVQALTEQCDDGNAIDLDACSNDCQDVVCYRARDGQMACKRLRDDGFIELCRNDANDQPVCMTAAVITGGTFTIGRPGAVGVNSPREGVAVTTFLIARAEATVAEYRTCVDNDSDPVLAERCSADVFDILNQQGADNLPIGGLDYWKARNFCQWWGGDVPTDAQWEYAASGTGGEDRHYPWGDQPPNCARAQYSNCVNPLASARPACTDDGGNPSLAGATPEGLCDMAGNVAEVTLDYYADNNRLYSDAYPPEMTGATDPVVTRTGQFNFSSAARGGHYRFGGSNNLGSSDRQRSDGREFQGVRCAWYDSAELTNIE
jgi:cysteine-rich repeat protein